MKTVIEMAREVLLLDERDNPNDDGIAQFIGTLTDFAELVRADEREACAKVAETYRDWDDTGMGVAAAIRERSNT
jgi:hypothetical protein